MRVPGLRYGTAWKEDATLDCVTRALDAALREVMGQIVLWTAGRVQGVDQRPIAG